MRITIADEIKEIVPGVTLGILKYTVNVDKSRGEFLNYFDQVIQELQDKYETAYIAEIQTIHQTREAYKALGRSPSRNRNAAEAMLRRIVKGDGLKPINNTVDINNLLSITTGYSIGSYDRQKLSGDILLQQAKEGDSYQGIGKKAVNIKGFPVLYDKEGPFGNPSSDALRTMLEPGEREVLSVIYGFTVNKSDVLRALEAYQLVLETYTSAVDMHAEII